MVAAVKIPRKGSPSKFGGKLPRTIHGMRVKVHKPGLGSPGENAQAQRAYRLGQRPMRHTYAGSSKP